MTSDRYLGLVGLSVCTVYHSSSTVPQQSRVLLVQYHFDRLKRLYGYNSSIPPRCPFTTRYHRGVHLLRDTTAVSIYYAILPRCPFTTRYYRGVHLLRDTTAGSHLPINAIHHNVHLQPPYTAWPIGVLHCLVINPAIDGWFAAAEYGENWGSSYYL